MKHFHKPPLVNRKKPTNASGCRRVRGMTMALLGVSSAAGGYWLFDTRTEETVVLRTVARSTPVSISGPTSTDNVLIELPRPREILAAIAAQANPSGEDLPGPTEPPPDDARTPLKEITPTEHQERLLYTAEEVAVRDCMRGRGFEYETNPPEIDAEREPWSGPLEPGDLASASAVGYGISDAIETGDAPSPPGPNDARLDGMDTTQRHAWERALLGRPIQPSGESSGALADPTIGEVSIEGGPKIRWDRTSCFAEARKAVFGDDAKDMQQTLARDTLRDEVRVATFEDPRYQAGVEQWRLCMSRRNLSYEYPTQAASELREEYTSGRLTLTDLRSKEVDVATVDAECFQDVGLGRIRTAAQERAEEAVRARNVELLANLVETHEESVARAEEILAASSN